MKKGKEVRGSIVDGFVEEVAFENKVIFAAGLIPIFEEFVDVVMGMDGLEQVTRKRVKGFKEKNEKN